jgi:hypothetical protein
VTGGYGKLRYEVLRDLYSSPSIIRIIRSKRMRWAGYAAQNARGGTDIGCGWEDKKKESARNSEM